MPQTYTILAVDDDPDFLDFLKTVLEVENYRIITAANGVEALRLFYKEKPSLVLLDINLPDVDGYTVCKNIRESSPTPIIMITGRVSEEERVEGLDAGADDYITKPFLPKELAARIRSVFRRSALLESNRANPLFRCQDLVIDFARKAVTLGGNILKLSATEYRLLALLARNANRTVAVEEILAQLWTQDCKLHAHIVQVNLSRLRQKLGDPAGLKYIQTKPGLGYLICSD